MSVGCHVARASAMAALKKRFFAVLPENSNVRGSASRDTSAGPDLYRWTGMMEV